MKPLKRNPMKRVYMSQVLPDTVNKKTSRDKTSGSTGRNSGSSPSFITKKKQSGNRILTILSSMRGRWKGILSVLLLLLGVGRLWFYVVILKDLPSFDRIGESFAQSTNITDKDGNTLYKVFDENRQYVSIADISENMVNAIVSAEDKGFRTNQGIDIKGLLRAGIATIRNRSLQGPGGSTITQQLIKLLLLTSDKKLPRKIKEIILATRIDDYLAGQVKKESPDLRGADLDKAVKGKILEMYMNYAFLGNNAYGIEAASNTYYGKSAKDLTVFESAVLASTFQLPSSYNPYRNTDRLIGNMEIISEDDPEVSAGTGITAAAHEKFIEIVNNSDKSIPRTSDGLMNWLSARGKFDFAYEGKTYNVSYNPGRKDYVLSRMYEDHYINEAEIKRAFIEGLTYTFKSASIDISAPHFVFRVQEFLKTEGCETGLLPRCFTEEELAKGGLVIKTSLDAQAQQIAEKSITDNLATIKGYGANNSSVIYLDSRNGDVLAYVGSANYNDDAIDGKVDMVQQMRQPGSSIKPFIYTYGFMNLPVAIDTTIYDLKFKIGNDQPNNSDGSFMGPMPLKTALGYSRNIPAIKMYFAVGGEEKLVPFLNTIGIASYSQGADYGYPMAIGSAELKMKELANAYMHLSAMGRPAKINPILEIKGSDGQIIYQKQPQQQQQVIPEGVAYLLWQILSDSTNLPSSWVNNFTVRGLKYANKSGTTDMKDSKGKLYPRDGWLAGYTPSKVAIFWAGNTQGNAMNANAYGGWVNGKTFRQFFSQMLGAEEIQSEEVSPVEVKNITISKISGKLVSDSTPVNYKVPTMGYVNTLPSAIDDSLSPLQIDKACKGKVTETTPKYDILDTFLVKPSTFMPNAMDLQDIINWFNEQSGTGATSGGSGTVFGELFLKAPEETCTNRQLLSEDTAIAVSLRKPMGGSSVTSTTNIWFDVTSPKIITSVRILVDETNIGEYAYPGKSSLSDIKKITIPGGLGKHTITVIAIDQDGGYNKKSVGVDVTADDTTPPELAEDRVSITKTSNGKYNVVMMFVDSQSAIEGGKISMTNGVELKKFSDPIVNLTIDIPQVLSYEVTDGVGNKKKGTIDVSLLVPPNGE